MINARYIEKFQQFETPFYFYDLDLLRNTLKAILHESSKYDYHIHYAIKANANCAVLETISSFGFGADCVSANEILRAKEKGIPSDKIAFAGVGKTDREIKIALENNIFSFNCESIPEIRVINEIAAKMGKIATIAIRINPNIDPKTHEYITTGLKENKFGINPWNFNEVKQTLQSSPNIHLTGLHFHIGSQITDMHVFEELSLKVNKVREWFEENGFEIDHINVGGGLGINYHNPDKELIPDFASYFKAFHDNLQLKEGQKVHFELGRSVVAQCGSLISRVLYLKEGMGIKFLILDAGMTELIRPALYKAVHAITNLTSTLPEEKYDIVGPICESSDTFAKGMKIAGSQRGDLIAILSAGAYGETMASTYNMRDLVKSYNSDQLGN